MPSIDVVIDLTREECLAHYEGWAQNVRTRSLDGRSVLFPASALRRIVGPDGVASSVGWRMPTCYESPVR